MAFGLETQNDLLVTQLLNGCLTFWKIQSKLDTNQFDFNGEETWP